MLLCMLTFCITFGSILGYILQLSRGAKVATILIFGSPGLRVGGFLQSCAAPYFQLIFCWILGSSSGVRGVQSMRWGRAPGHVSFNMLA